MSEYDELGRTLRTLLLQEADAMDIDTREATERLTRELGPAAPRRRQVMVALVACALVVVALLVWSNRGEERRGIAPADDRNSSSPEAPYYLDLADGATTAAPQSAAVLLETMFDLAFSPEGDRAAYGPCSGDPGRCSPDDQLFLAEADGTDQRPLDPPAGLNAYFPAWSPDGTKLVYQARQGGVADVGNLYLHDLATGERTRLTDLDLSLPMFWPMEADFSPDGERVAYSRPRTSKLDTPWDVWEVPVAGGDATRLFENAKRPQYLADGRIAFFRPGADDDSPDTLVAAAPGGEAQVLAEYEAEDGTDASPDRTRIAYVDNGVLHLLDLASGESDDTGGRNRVRLGRRRPAPGRPRPRAAVVPGPDCCGPSGHSHAIGRGTCASACLRDAPTSRRQRRTPWKRPTPTDSGPPPSSGFSPCSSPARSRQRRPRPPVRWTREQRPADAPGPSTSCRSRRTPWRAGTRGVSCPPQTPIRQRSAGSLAAGLSLTNRCPAIPKANITGSAMLPIEVTISIRNANGIVTTSSQAGQPGPEAVAEQGCAQHGRPDQHHQQPGHACDERDVEEGVVRGRAPLGQ